MYIFQFFHFIAKMNIPVAPWGRRRSLAVGIGTCAKIPGLHEHAPCLADVFLFGNLLDADAQTSLLGEGHVLVAHPLARLCLDLS